MIAVFGDKANTIALVKGDRAYIEGKLKLETWTGKDGVERQGLNVAAWKVERLGEIGRNKAAEPRADGTKSAPPQQSAPPRNGNGERRPPARDWQWPPTDDMDLPF